MSTNHNVWRERTTESEAKVLLCWELRAAKAKVLPVRPAVGQSIAVHASPTVGKNPCSKLYRRDPFNFVSKSSSYILTALVTVNTVSHMGPRDTVGHHARSHKRLESVSMESARRIIIDPQTCIICIRVQELCERRDGRPVPDSLYGLCGRKATLNLNWCNI